MSFDSRVPVESDGELHARLLARDPTAPSDLAVRYLAPLTSWLLRTFGGLDPQILEEIAIDILLDLGERPEHYNPSKGSLPVYLRMAARGDVTNHQRSLARRRRHEVVGEDVEHLDPAGNRSIETADFAETLARREREQRLLQRLREHCTEQEWQVVQLMADGERRTTAFADALGLTELPAREQAREVKRVKDRLVKRLRRLRDREADETDDD